jgi:small-conductance mechanosensitive channel
MNHIEHNDKSAVNACENDRILKGTLKSKQIIMFIYIAAVVIGLGFFIVTMITDNGTQPVFPMLLIWACGSIANLFDKDSMIRKFLASIFNGIKEAINSHSLHLLIGGIGGVVIGTVLGVIIMGICSPIMIIACLIGINKVKKQIACNNEILS